MSSLPPRLRYELVLGAGWSLAVAVAVMAVGVWELTATPPDLRAPRAALTLLELLVPVTAGLVAAEAAARDWSEGTAGWRVALPGGPVALLAWRLGAAFVAWSVAAAACLLAVRTAYFRPAGLAWAWRDWALLLAPPAAFLAALGLLGALVGRHALGGFLAAVGFWVVDWTSGGTRTAPFHVLYLRAPLEDWTYEATRWWLGGGAAVLVLAALLAFARGERWVR